MAVGLKIGDDIPLTPEQRTALGRQLLDLVSDLESQHSTYFSDIATWWQWYEGVPAVKQKSTPWPNASNIVIPFIRSQADPMVARTVLGLFSTDKLWWGTTENTATKELLPHIFDYLNLTANRSLSTFDSVDPAVLEQHVIGESYLGQHWVDDSRWVMLPKAKKATRVLVRCGPEFYHRPRENWLFPRSKQIHQAEVVIEQVPMTWTELAGHCQGDNAWDVEAAESIKSNIGLRGPSQAVRDVKEKAQGLANHSRSSNLPLYDIRQATLDWPMLAALGSKDLNRPTHLFDTELDGAIHVQIKVWFDAHSGTILRAIYDPYLLPEKPFYGLQYRRRGSAAGGSAGLAKIGAHVQRALSTHANQMFDAITLSNSIKFMTSDRELSERGWSPNTIPYVRDLDAFKELTAQKQIFPDIAAANFLQAVGERIMGQSDPNLGRETRLGGHAQPATNFLGLLEQSQINSSRPLKSIRTALSRAGQDRALMAQVFETNEQDWLASEFDQDDSAKILEWLEGDSSLYGSVHFDVYAMSEIHNPDAERQKALMVDQLVTNYFVTVSKFVEMMANPQVPEPTREAMRQGVLAKTKSLSRFLEVSDVDDIEAYVLQMGNNSSDNRAALTAVSDRLGQPAPGAAGPPGPPGAAPVLTSIPGGGASGTPSPARVSGAGALP